MPEVAGWRSLITVWFQSCGHHHDARTDTGQSSSHEPGCAPLPLRSRDETGAVLGRIVEPSDVRSSHPVAHRLASPGRPLPRQRIESIVDDLFMPIAERSFRGN
jgi:hypothetical protein